MFPPVKNTLLTSASCCSGVYLRIMETSETHQTRSLSWHRDNEKAEIKWLTVTVLILCQDVLQRLHQPHLFLPGQRRLKKDFGAAQTLRANKQLMVFSHVECRLQVNFILLYQAWRKFEPNYRCSTECREVATWIAGFSGSGSSGKSVSIMETPSPSSSSDT